MIRIFIGVEINDQTRKRLLDEMAYLKRTAPAVKWAPPENLHFTLKFIGNIPTADLGEVLTATEEAAKEVEPFTLSIEGLGCFPDPERPRIIWAGCGMGSDDMTRLAKSIEDACAEFGYQPEKRLYTPHLTLGRVKHPRDAAELAPLIEDGRREHFGDVYVDSAVVFMSELKRKGARYTPMQHSPLGADF